MFYKPLNNNRGSSLAATLVALGISGVIISTVLTTVTMGWGQLAQQEGRANRALLVDDIRAELSDSNRCKSGLAAHTKTYTSGADGSPLTMRMANGTEVKSGANLDGYGLSVKSFKFVSKSQTNVSGVGTVHYGDLFLTADLKKNKTFDLAEKPIGKMTLVVSGSTISECNMDGMTGKDEICETIGGNWNGKECTLPTSLLAMDDVCKRLGGTWSSGSCEMPSRTVASTPTPPTPSATPKPPTGPQKVDPNCFERNENVTWCVTSCASSSDNASEKWTLINKVRGPDKATPPNCPKVGYTSTCRYKVTCKMK